MKFGIFTGIIMASSLLAAPLANAKDFSITNATKNNITFEVNHICSDKFGVISADSTKAISEADFNRACKGMPLYCEAKVYHSDNCTGEKIANVVFDTRIGVKDIKSSSNYAFTYNDYLLIISSPIKK